MHLEYPECVLEIDEMNAIFDAEEVVGQKFEDNIADCDSNTSIAGSSETGIKRREKILGINPQDTDSLELRRFRVMMKWYDSYPYTQESLMNKMDILLGNGNYTLAVVPEEMRMICLLGLYLYFRSIFQVVGGASKSPLLLRSSHVYFRKSPYVYLRIRFHLLYLKSISKIIFNGTISSRSFLNSFSMSFLFNPRRQIIRISSGTTANV